jgi:hypothetical protein
MFNDWELSQEFQSIPV